MLKIEAIDLVKTFGTTKAADHLSLDIPANTIYGLLGPNGAGKTTFIRMATTITRPDSGTLLFDGQPLHEAHALQMGYMPEERGLYKKMSVLDQLVFFAEIKGMPHATARQEAIKWLKRLDMATWAGKKLEELSKGMAQKVQFLCTIIHKPQFIILDEPFSGFDPVNADLIKDLIQELHRDGATILFSTHRMDNVEELCEHLCIIHRGKVALHGDADSIRRRHFSNVYSIEFSNKVAFNNDLFKIVSEGPSAENRYHYSIHSEAENREALVQYAATLGGLTAFGEDLPTIHQIFVNTVTTEI